MIADFRGVHDARVGGDRIGPKRLVRRCQPAEVREVLILHRLRASRGLHPSGCADEDLLGRSERRHSEDVRFAARELPFDRRRLSVG